MTNKVDLIFRNSAQLSKIGFQLLFPFYRWNPFQRAQIGAEIIQSRLVIQIKWK